MSPKSKKKANCKKKNNHRRNCSQEARVIKQTNFLPEAGQGCHIVRFDDQSHSLQKMKESEIVDVIGWDQDIYEEDFEGQEVPDVAMDPDNNTFTLCNICKSITKIAYISIIDEDCYGLGRKKFTSGWTMSSDDDYADRHSCVTFIAIIPPMTFVTLCEVRVEDITTVKVESDVQEWKQHPDKSLNYPTPLKGFPLDGGPFVCTQGCGGHLTHFFSGNYFAIDFRCDIGTPVLAVEDGEVVEVQDGNTVTGIAVSNMFKWNSILIRHHHDDGNDCPKTFYTEYVHIRSSIVKKGQRVGRGAHIGYSGNIGFCPEPHLHFTVYLSDELDAPSVAFWFDGADGKYQPIAGKVYDASGQIDNKV